MAQITAAGLSTHSGVALVLNRNMGLIQRNTEEFDFLGLGLHTNLGATNGLGTDTMKETIVEGMGQGGMTALTGETEYITPGGITTDSLDTSWGRYGRKISLSDVSMEIQGARGVNEMTVQTHLVQARRVASNELAAQTWAAGTQTVTRGAGATTMTLLDLYYIGFAARQYHVKPFANGRLFGVFSRQALDQLQIDALNQDQTLKNHAETKNLAGVRFGNHVYEWDGLLFTHYDGVTQNGSSEYVNGIFGRNSMRYIYSDRKVIPGFNQLTMANMPGFMLEWKRDDSEASAATPTNTGESTLYAVATQHHGMSIHDEQVLILNTAAA